MLEIGTFGVALPPCPCSDRCCLAHCYATSQTPTYIIVSLSGEYREGVAGGIPLPVKVYRRTLEC